MTDKRDDEVALRAQARAARGTVVAGSGTAIEPRKLDQMVSLRLDPEILAGVRELANQAGTSVSEVLRRAATELVAAADRRRVVVSITEYRGTCTVGEQSQDLDQIQRVVTATNIAATAAANWPDLPSAVV